MKNFCALYLFCFFCWTSFVFGQKDSLRLQEITVTDYRSKIAKRDFNEVTADSSTKNAFCSGSATQLLLQLNTCFVKAYGPSNIASLSVRGSTAQQTAVVWNGININNPMLGQSDISLLPVVFFDSFSLQKGALSGYWGSGAVAGVLNLGARLNENPLRAKAGVSGTSTGNITQYAIAEYKLEKLTGATKLYADLAENRYAYYQNDTVKKQSHARARQFALMQDLGYSINDKQTVGLHLWLQQADREVPYSILEKKEDARQKDNMLRLIGDWKLAKNNYSLTARSAFMNESLLYMNTTYSVNSDSRFSSIVAEAEGVYYLPKDLTVTGGTSNIFSFAQSEGYNGSKRMSKNALYENVSWKWAKLLISLYGREELFNGKTFVPTFGGNISYDATKWMLLSVNAGTVYRYPTLNDLYWSQGGNPDLVPEHGASEDASLKLYASWKSVNFSLKGTIFNRNIANWIMWVPGKAGIWSPQNVLNVWSRGAETVSEVTFKREKFSTSVFVTTNYVLTSRMAAQLENDNTQGLQMPYVPMYSGSANWLLAYRNVFIRAAYSYTGYRYLTNDNFEYLQPYQVVDACVGYNLYYRNTTWNLFAEVNNLLDQNYYSVAQYAMPLRNFRIGIQFEYNKIKTQK